MAYTVAASFDQFYSNINLGGDHRETANRRKDDVVRTLEKSFEVVEAFSSGSIPKFTALKAHADVDVIVALNWMKHIAGRTPTQVLQSVRDALAAWRTGVRRNGQAVTLYYKTWPNVDIVPVYTSDTYGVFGNVAYYNVPDSNTDTWLKSRPKQHADAIETKASLYGPNFRKIIKMVKHWNRIHSQYLQSYHIEVLALNVFSSDLSDLPWHLFQFFKNARSVLETPLWYDLGFVDDYLSWGDRLEVLKRFDTAMDKSRDAWWYTYGAQNDHARSIGLWQQIFGSEFPSYG